MKSETIRVFYAIDQCTASVGKEKDDDDDDDGDEDSVVEMSGAEYSTSGDAHLFVLG